MKALGSLLDRFSWPLYCRSYLATLGGLLAGFGGLLIAHEAGGYQALSPGWQTGLALALLAGAALLLTSVFASPRIIERWSDALSRHEVALFLMVLALPLYGLLLLLRWRR